MHRGALGGLLIDQACFEEAESLLLRAAPRLKEIGGDHTSAWRSVQRDLVRLYERWSEADRSVDCSRQLVAARQALESSK